MLSFLAVLTIIALGGYLLMRPDTAPAPPSEEELTPWQAPKPKAARRAVPPPKPAPREKTAFEAQREEIRKEQEERAERIDIEMKSIPITMYCTASSAKCKEAHEWFVENDYELTEHDVEKDGRYMRERDRLNPAKSVPTILIGDNVFDEFEAKDIERKLREMAVAEID